MDGELPLEEQKYFNILTVGMALGVSIGCISDLNGNQILKSLVHQVEQSSFYLEDNGEPLGSLRKRLT